jgi:Asp-tRNA(Asn)/Glu-tRNA(Gln) amidotransferase A subunit family amidase
MQLHELSATALAAQLRSGAVSPVAAVEAYIVRITAVNSRINAVAAERFAEARAEAQQAAALPPAERGPLHGLPISIKEALDVAGMPATCGLVSRAGRVAERDAAVVARLRAAGAIIVATTITPDSCWGQETANPLHGLTRNPWDVRRTVGGSTGGEAALIAAGGSALGIGSDIAGSIRLPAAFCGIAGLRPTSGALPEDGFWPPSIGSLAHLNALGPMARRVEDLALAWDVLRGAEPTLPDPAILRGRAVAHWVDDGLTTASKAIAGGVRAAAGALEAAGMRSMPGAPAARRLAGLAWGAFHGTHGRQAIAAGFGNGTAWSPYAELLRTLAGRGRIGRPSLTNWLITHAAPELNAVIRIDPVRWRAELQAQFVELVGDGVAVCPIFPTTAPRHGWSGMVLHTASYQVWVNLAGLPGLTVPVGRNGRGMPVGVQLVAAPGGEQMLLAAGMAVQQALMPQWRGPALG